MATVHIGAALRGEIGGLAQVQAAGSTLREVVQDLERQFPGFGARIIDAAGIRPEVMVAVANDEVRSPDVAVGPETEVYILPAIAGG
ncbi:MAG: MoaD/ThiS family protein [Dehalococcoidia bacterium]|nr:MoaD/ThiS family protein [Dehalococcoidia bacterium]MCA9825195.1 MoaD/ThiS family protein [Dehalococcoidia bacterium]MCA9844974.1 MoaD/ThiS family protein [Dehalococcoidia bacterium]MCA9852140.1 MoaD/ThiS family protein [Dehalococcoidia bacterium]